MTRLPHFTLLAAATALLLAGPARADVSAQEAEQLKTTLTPFGAEKAGSKDGSIPAWTGGLTQPIKRVDPRLPALLYPDEKPILQIKADNADAQGDRLTEGHKVMLKTYPGFRIDVYPSHRTFAAPQFFYDQSVRNATQTKLVNSVLTNYKGGVPFPIPKTGEEVMFNSQWVWRGADRQFTGETWFVSSAGKRSLSSALTLSESWPYGYNDRKDPWDGKLRGTGLVETSAPAYSAGEKTLILGPRDPINDETQGWTYFTGQRRLRKIPNVQYDVPFPFTSGNTNYDDSFGFNGATDRYDWKLVGKKEMVIPYNNNDIAHVADLDKLMGPQYVNPDHVRFELHRVWVIDGVLKAGARHTVPKRRFYIDEDSWNILVTDQWDGKGQFWKSISLATWVFPEVPVQQPYMHMVYNVQGKSYAVMNTINRAPGTVTFKAVPPELYTTQSLERSGVR